MLVDEWIRVVGPLARAMGEVKQWFETLAFETMT
jgi:hypothetical protein